MNQKIGRNDLCPCGSGKKYKACCLQKKTTPSNRTLAGRCKPVAKTPTEPVVGPNLMDVVFGNKASGKETFQPLPSEEDKTQ